jgi:hypothetical protein
MNRTLSSSSRLNATLKGQALGDRRSRTKMLIQVGALVKMSGLLPICDIEEGEDFQFDIASRDKAAILLGIILEAVGKISSPPDAGLLECWRESGTRFLKQRAAQAAYQKAKKIF